MKVQTCILSSPAGCIPRWGKGDEESLGSDLNDRRVKLFNIVACWLTLYWIKRTSNYMGH
jgi:hypothetical protein